MGWEGVCSPQGLCCRGAELEEGTLSAAECRRALGCRWGGGGEAERGCEGAWSPRALFPSTDPMENGDTEARVGCSGEGGLLCSLG